MHKYFSPKRFVKIANAVFPYVLGLSLLFFCAGIYLALLASPPDYQQGDAVRIMYVHVPSAWMAIGLYVLTSALCAASLIWKSPLSDMMALATAKSGVVFNVICLVTGSLWGKPMWGTYWVWDARLTSVLVLLFFYIGYLFIANAFDDKERGLQSAAVFALVGLINIPVIKFSVEWWNTLHQPASVIRKDGMAIDSTMLLPLFTMFAALVFFFLTLFILQVKTAINHRKIERLQIKMLNNA